MAGVVILGFDTATADAAVAVAVGEELAAERRAGPGPGGRPRHAAVLLDAIEGCVADAGGWARIERIAVGVGPGTFTGLRVGIATARALGQARGLPVAAVGSLAALGRGIAEREPEGPSLPMIDARRGEAFAAVYDGSGTELVAAAAVAPERLVEQLAGLPGTPVAAGDGSVRFRHQLESAGVKVLPDADPVHRMAARHVCALGATIEAGAATDVRPAYLRRPDAEVWREQRNRDSRTG